MLPRKRTSGKSGDAAAAAGGSQTPRGQAPAANDPSPNPAEKKKNRTSQHAIKCTYPKCTVTSENGEMYGDEKPLACLLHGRVHAALKTTLTYPEWVKKILEKTEYRKAVELAIQTLGRQDKDHATWCYCACLLKSVVLKCCSLLHKALPQPGAPGKYTRQVHQGVGRPGKHAKQHTGQVQQKSKAKSTRQAQGSTPRIAPGAPA